MCSRRRIIINHSLVFGMFIPAKYNINQQRKEPIWSATDIQVNETCAASNI